MNAKENNEQFCQTSTIKYAHSVANKDKAVEPIMIV